MDNMSSVHSQLNEQKHHFIIILSALSITAVTVFIVSLIVGRAGIINPIKCVQSLYGRTEDYQQMTRIVQSIRLPRTLAAFIIGASLSVAGLVYQTTFNNKLVSPDILGVSSGCCVGAGLAILFGLSAVFIRLTAFVFGFFAVLVTVFLPKLFRNHSPLTLILSGIIVGSFMDSIMSVIKYVADRNEKLADIVFWIMGSVAGIQIDEVLGSILINILPFIILLLMGWRINVVSLGMEEAQSLGINYKANRFTIIICSTLLTANCVSISGNVGWVGLVIPHIARALVGDDAHKSTPTAALCGGLFLMTVDILSRLISVNEIPISIITGFFGAIIYTIVLARRGRFLNE